MFFSRGTAEDSGAAVSLENYSSVEYSASWTDVQVESNQTIYPSYAVSVSVVGHKLFWVSTSPGRSSLLGSTSTNPSGMGQAASALGVTGELSVSGVDFGESSSADENEGVDVYHAPSSSEYVAETTRLSSAREAKAAAVAGSPMPMECGIRVTSQNKFIGHVVNPDTRATVSNCLWSSNSTAQQVGLDCRPSQVANGASQSWRWFGELWGQPCRRILEKRTCRKGLGAGCVLRVGGGL